MSQMSFGSRRIQNKSTSYWLHFQMTTYAIISYNYWSVGYSNTLPACGRKMLIGRQSPWQKWNDFSCVEFTSSCRCERSGLSPGDNIEGIHRRWSGLEVPVSYLAVEIRQQNHDQRKFALKMTDCTHLKLGCRVQFGCSSYSCCGSVVWMTVV
jgi:hypothetical protein